MLITTRRHASAMAALRQERDDAVGVVASETAHWRTAEAERDEYRRRLSATVADIARYVSERDAARADQVMWRDTAREALKAIADLQRRYAPPAPIEGDVVQPPSVERADAQTVADAQAVADARNPKEVGG